MTSSGQEWRDPDASDEGGSPASGFPGAGERVDDAKRQEALEAEPAGNATVADMVDTGVIDSRAHERGVAPDEAAGGVEPD